MMTRRKPPPRIVTDRSNNNAKRKLVIDVPDLSQRVEFATRVKYDPYSKHKYNPTAYGLAPYAGEDEERTYCDEHANFTKADIGRIPVLMERGIKLCLWSESRRGGTPNLLWTIDDNGWIYELRTTNATQCQYHGYPILQGDAFARQVLARARIELAALGPAALDVGAAAAISVAETFYR